MRRRICRCGLGRRTRRRDLANLAEFAAVFLLGNVPLRLALLFSESADAPAAAAGGSGGGKAGKEESEKDSKEKEAEAQKLLPFLPESLKKLAEFQTWERARMEDFAARQPELLAELCARKEANPTVAGIVATAAAPRDPAACKYTVEGTVVHDVMSKLAMMERAKETMYDGLYITLTPADKAKWKEKVIESMAEIGRAHV